MAQRTQVILISDLSGDEIKDGGESISFSYRGADYTIDLAEKFIALRPNARLRMRDLTDRTADGLCAAASARLNPLLRNRGRRQALSIRGIGIGDTEAGQNAALEIFPFR